VTRTYRPITFGTHNLHDETGIPTFFADVIGFTEAIGVTIRRRARRLRTKAALSGYQILVCKDQRDLVMAIKRSKYKVIGERYITVHGGRAEVTPHRGEWAVECVRRVGPLRRPIGRKEVFFLGHRINAAFPPYIRGEAMFRSQRWESHDRISNGMIEAYLLAGWVVRAGGDANTPKNRPQLNAYDALGYEVGRGEFDRLASSEEIIEHGTKSRKGSDHKRLWAKTR
jgi:hypothetical protein